MASRARQANDLGTAHARQGRLGAAAAQFQRAVALEPNLAEAHNNLGNIRQAQGDLAGAMASYRRSLAIRPDFGMAHDNLGLVLLRMGEPDAAAASHQRAIDCDPNSAAAHFNLGTVLLHQEHLEAAADCLRTALALRPDYADAHTNLGQALRCLGDLPAALECYRAAVALRPDDPLAQHNLGNLLLEQGLLDESIACHRRALALRPDYFAAQINLGNGLQGQGRIAEALACYRRAIMIRPDDPSGHVNAAFMLLLTGDFAAGWREYEWRRRAAAMARPELTMPAWEGQPLAGKTILLHCEQGFGDSLQFIRYAPLVKERGAVVVVACPPPLARLFGTVAGIDRICPDGSDLPACDYHSPLMSLPHLFATALDSIPAPIPYLAARPLATSVWALRMAPRSARKIGLVWAGNPRIDQTNAHRVDRRRSMRLEDFAPLGAIPGVRFFSLQKDRPAGQTGLELTDLMDDVADFADTAGLIANLDLVIGVDTSVIHLAGAMGKPVWVLSRFDGCWRWLQERSDSPWYPSLRLFRQRTSGDWGPVVAEVAEALLA